MINTKNAGVDGTPANQIIRKPILFDYTMNCPTSKEDSENNLSDPLMSIDFSIVALFPSVFKQCGSALPKELLNQPRWFGVVDGKIAHMSWNLLENQQPFNKVNGNKGFDISGHDLYPDYLVLDWDHVYNPQTGEWVNDFAHYTFNWIVLMIPNVYVECSVSKCGFHMLLHPTDPDLSKITNSSKNVLQFGDGAKLEMFYKNKAKCVVFTGYKISDSSEIASGDQVNMFVRQLLDEIHLFNQAQVSDQHVEQNQLRAQEMLKYIPVTNLNRADWRTVIRCWKDLGMSYDTLEQWSQTDPRHNDGNDLNFKQTWDTMEPGDPNIAIKTLCKWADQYGGYTTHYVDRTPGHKNGASFLDSGIDSKRFFDTEWTKYTAQTQQVSTRTLGFKNLDQVQMFNNGIYALGGIPAVGKSTFLTQIGEHLAFNGESVLYLSFEIPAHDLYSKLLVRGVKRFNPQTSLTSQNIREGVISTTISQVQQYLIESDYEFKIEYVPNNVDIDMVINFMEIWVQNHDNTVIILDYLQKIHTSKGNTAKDKIDYIVDQIQSFQTKHNITVVIASSFNRSSYRSDVSLDSFKESGGIEYSAHVLWGLQYAILEDKESGVNAKGLPIKGVSDQEMKQAKHQTPRQMMLRCVKNRFGMEYVVYLDYYSEYDLFLPKDLDVLEEKYVNWYEE